jgi:exosortase K
MSPARRSILPLTAVLLTLAFGLKWWYRSASMEELGFMLRPVAWLVQLASGDPFVYDPVRGYLFHGLGIAIDRSCSGINFLVIAVSALSLIILQRGDGGCAHPLLALLASGGAYLLAIVVNSGRILTMAWAQRAGLHFSPRAHEAIGAFFFLFALILAAIALHHLLSRRPSPSHT